MNEMKRKWKLRMRTVIVSACMVAACGLPVLAQESGAPPQPPSEGQAGPPQGGPGGGAQMLDRMTKDLSLTTDQVAQAKVILEAEREQMTALRNDTSSSQADKRTKMTAIREATQAKIRAILTGEQKTKFDEMEARRKQRGGGPPAGGGQGGGDGPPSGPPPQA